MIYADRETMSLTKSISKPCDRATAMSTARDLKLRESVELTDFIKMLKWILQFLELNIHVHLSFLIVFDLISLGINVAAYGAILWLLG